MHRRSDSPPRRTGLFRPLLELLRPANVATAAADVLAGAAVATAGDLDTAIGSLALLLAATTCLYGGGIVLNDFFDRDVDALERPERPIPSGRIRAWEAATLGFGLLTAGVGFAGMVGVVAGLVAGAVVLAVLAYDAIGKHHQFIGPVNMGLCRALNLLLGVAIVPAALAWAWPLGLLPLVYIGAVTMVSRGEVHGARRPVVRAGLWLVAAVVAVLGAMAVLGGLPPSRAPYLADRLWALLLVAGLGWRVIPAFQRAATAATPDNIRAAVRSGVLSLVLVDAVIAASYAGIMNSLPVLAAGLLAWRLARLFAVT